MTNDRMARWLGPLGLGFLVAIVLGFFVVGPQNAPSDTAPAVEVIAFYQAHIGRTWASLYIVGVGLVLLTFFVSGLSHVLRAANPTRSWLATAAFGGGMVAIAGFGITGLNHMIVLEAAENGNLALASQTNFIDQQYPVPVFLGMVTLTLAVGFAIVAGSTLPKWAGWLSLAVGVVAALGPIGFFAFLAFPVWATVLGFVAGHQAPAAEAGATTGTTATHRRLIPRHHH